MNHVVPGRTFIIAEAGVNHNGDLQLARELVDTAAGAGADAVKFQTFDAERLVTADAPKALYQLQTSSASESQLDMLRRLELSPEQHVDLSRYCKDKSIVFLSTPFDEQSADFLVKLGVPMLKVPSGEITNLPYLSYVARLQRPLIMSTGMACLGEVENAVRTIHGAGNADLVLLHCVSSYPADPAAVNLRAMQTMATAFGCPVGYSDHTEGIEVAIAAVSLGACVIEKHFTLSRSLPGPDHRMSLEGPELRALVRGIRNVEAAMGDGRKVPRECEASTAETARRSLVTAYTIPSGTVLTEAMVTVKRPGTGLAPAMRPQVIGRVLRVDAPAETVITLDMLV